MKNREFESLTQVNLPGGGSCRVWRTEATWSAAVTPDNRDIKQIAEALGSDPLALGLALEALPRVSAIAIVDAAGNGATLYPDWK